MAFDLSTWATAKYRFSFTGDEATSYVAEIHEDGFSGSVTVVDAISREALTTNWKRDGDDEYASLAPSGSSISIYDENEAIIGDLIDAINDVEDDYLLVVRSGDDIKWIGRVDPDGISYGEDGPVALTLSASDGLGRLDAIPYISATDGSSADTGAVTLVSVIADCLASTGLGLGFFTSTSFYPKTSPVLGADDNPLENIWVDKIAFTSDRDGGGQGMISKLAVLRSICDAFGMVCFQAEGAWHLIQANHLHANSYRRFRYNSAGTATITASNSPEVYEDIDPRQTISDETVKRTPATASFLKANTASIVQYQHGPIQLIRSPQFEPLNIQEGEAIWNGSYPWTTGSGASLVSLDKDDWGMGVSTVDGIASGTTGFNPLAANSSVVNADNSGGQWTTLIGNNYAYQATQTLQSGALLGVTFQAYGKTFSASPSAQRKVDEFLSFQVKHAGSSTRYLYYNEDGSLDWTTTNTWILLKNKMNKNGWLNVALKDVEALGSDGPVTLTLGPIITDETSEGVWDKVVYDNAQLFPILADGTINHTATSSVNFINRAKPFSRSVATILGDGPTTYNKGSMFIDSGKAAVTADWEETTSGHSGADTNDDHSTVLGRVILTSTNVYRAKHTSNYFGFGRIITPLDVLSRSGGLYPFWDITAFWQKELTSGTWYRSEENGFTDDLETGINTGSGSSTGDFGRGISDSVGFFLSQNEQTFNSDASKRITRTTEVIPAGSSTADVDVEAIASALLDTNDTIILVSPDLTYHRLAITQDQLAGDTNIQFDDPDNPGNNYTFDWDVPIGANIFLVDDELLTLVRLGAGGFAVTVLGKPVGKADEAKSGTHTTLAVKEWLVSVESGESVWIDQDADGEKIELVLTADAPRGATSISFASTEIDTTVDDPIKPNGSVGRSEFSVTADAITATVGVPERTIATVTGTPSWDGTNTSIPLGTSLTNSLGEGDTVIFYKAGGGYVNATVKTSLSVSGTPLVLSDADGDQTSNIASGDKIAPGTLTSLRLDMDGIEVTATRLASSNYSAGTAGWKVDNDGSAEFSDVAVRGTLTILPGSSGVSNLADAGDLATVNTISAPYIDPGAVLEGALATGAVTENKIGASAVIEDKLADAAVATAKLAASAVTTVKIADGAITADKIFANAVVAGKIAAGAVTADEINVSTLSAISADLGTITAGALNINGAFIVDASGNMTATSASISGSISSGGSILAGGGTYGIYDDGTFGLKAGSSIGNLIISESSYDIDLSVPTSGFNAGSLNLSGTSTTIFASASGGINLSAISGGVTVTGSLSDSGGALYLNSDDPVLTLDSTGGTVTPDTVLVVDINGTKYKIDAEAV